MDGTGGSFTIVLNGREHPVEGGATVEALLASLELGEGQRVAVMVNGEVIKRERRATAPLAPGDGVEVVHMVGGG